MGLTLVLVRHGETDWTAHRRYCGRADISLNGVGREQATRLASLASESYSSIWTSPLARCRETAALMGVVAATASELQEFDFGEIEGKRWEDLDSRTQAALVDVDGFVAPGGESVAGFTERIDGFVSTLSPGRHLLVSHGGVIRHLLRRAGRSELVAPGAFVEISVRAVDTTS